jgi:hypothetical protein
MPRLCQHQVLAQCSTPERSTYSSSLAMGRRTETDSGSSSSSTTTSFLWPSDFSPDHGLPNTLVARPREARTPPRHQPEGVYHPRRRRPQGRCATCRRRVRGRQLAQRCDLGQGPQLAESGRLAVSTPVGFTCLSGRASWGEGERKPVVVVIALPFPPLLPRLFEKLTCPLVPLFSSGSPSTSCWLSWPSLSVSST